MTTPPMTTLPAADDPAGAIAPRRVLIAVPVYNEEKYIPRVLEAVLGAARPLGADVLVVDDGSTDATADLLRDFRVATIRHQTNLGYGRSIRDAFDHAARGRYDWVITMDCDEQHEPAELPRFVRELSTERWDIVSGSRYLAPMPGDPTFVPPDRRAINLAITGEINQRLSLNLTDAFCGFKAHRVAAMSRLRLSEDGYAFPMQLWVQAVARGMRIVEVPVALIYKDLMRSFGEALNDPEVRLLHYRQVLHCELRRAGATLSEVARAELLPCPDRR
jgi:glycosyltransferase involved in cell wall biosynthesis